jgi:hypothetical protein
MSVKMRSRREFLGTAGVPLSAGLLAGSAKRMRAESGSSQAARDASLPIEVANGASPVRVKEAVLFPFDDHSIPMIWGLKLDLIMGKNPGAINPVVLRPGPPGTPDSESVRYYGTVIQVGNELRMWYLGRGDKRKGGLLPLYAVSKDGVHWEKPRLGLVEYNGNKQNNVVQLLEDKYSLGESVVIYDPDDTEARRFKMVFESAKYNNRLAVACSPDGLRWTESPRNPVGPWLEESGLVKYNGCYYVNGQGGGLYGGGRLRTMTTVASCDFEHWTDACAMSFRRGSTSDLRLDRWNTWEEVHLGASLMSRGNVIMGIYGMWHGDPAGDRSRVTIDLGLIVSNDALHFREPVPDFRFVPAREEQEVAPGRAALAQGQGMVNLGDKTHYWYEAWGQPAGGIRMATWEGDRFGFFRGFDKEFLPRDPYGRSLPAHFISCPMKLDRAGAGIFVNADGLSNNSELTVELLDHQFQKIPGYSSADCIPIRTSGLRQAARWRTRQNLEVFSHPIRVRVNFGGIRPEDAKLYAVYVGGAAPMG